MVTCIGGSYSDVIAEVSNRDTLGGEEVESSELLNEQNKRKRVYPSAGVCVHLRNYMYKYTVISVLCLLLCKDKLIIMKTSGGLYLE